MMQMEEALEKLGYKPDRTTLEMYISRAWVRPARHEQHLQFEEIDIARVRLVYHLQEELQMSESAMDMVLHLLDQVYGLREQLRHVHHAIAHQPYSVRKEILTLLQTTEEYTDV